MDGAAENAMEVRLSAYHFTWLPLIAVAVSTGEDVPWQTTKSVVVGTTGLALTTTSKAERGPSQPVAVLVWLTKYTNLPSVEVLGTGAVVNEVAIVLSAYHFKT